MAEKEESTGTVGTGASWSNPLPTETDDKARIVYVGVPNEDSIRMSAEHFERQPRIHAMNMSISHHPYGDTRSIEEVVREASVIEQYLVHGTVPDAPKAEGPTEGDA